MDWKLLANTENIANEMKWMTLWGEILHTELSPKIIACNVGLVSKLSFKIWKIILIL